MRFSPCTIHSFCTKIFGLVLACAGALPLPGVKLSRMISSVFIQWGCKHPITSIVPSLCYTTLNISVLSQPPSEPCGPSARLQVNNASWARLLQPRMVFALSSSFIPRTWQHIFSSYNFQRWAQWTVVAGDITARCRHLITRTLWFYQYMLTLLKITPKRAMT
jgi:hypothetical protein